MSPFHTREHTPTNRHTGELLCFLRIVFKQYFFFFVLQTEKLEDRSILQMRVCRSLS